MQQWCYLYRKLRKLTVRVTKKGEWLRETKAIEIRFESGYYLNKWGTGMCWGEIDGNSGGVYFLNMQGGGSIWSCLVCVENGNSCWIIYFKLIVCAEFLSYPSCKFGASCGTTDVTQLYLRFVQIKNIDKRHNIPWASVGWRWSIIQAKLFLFLHWRSKLPPRKWSFSEFNSTKLEVRGVILHA